MVAAFKTYIQQHTNLTDADVEQVCLPAIQKTVQRNELLLHEGQVCRYKIFVATGLLRNYGTVADGSEHILQFAPENSWTLDVESYDRQTPATINIAAIEYSEVLLWPKAEFDRLLMQLPGLKAFSQQIISRNIYNSRQRILMALSATPEEKYDDFVQTHPTLLSRLPLHMIASYLGISLKTLTRLRHAQLHR